jgi:hypothetical protein
MRKVTYKFYEGSFPFPIAHTHDYEEAKACPMRREVVLENVRVAESRPKKTGKMATAEQLAAAKKAIAKICEMYQNSKGVKNV